MQKRIPPTEAMQLREMFQATVNNNELDAFVSDSSLAVYGFKDDPASLEYAAYIKLIFPGRSTTHTIDFSKSNGGVHSHDVTDRKVLVCSHEFDDDYVKFLRKRFGKLEDQEAILMGDVRYVTAKPYQMRRIERPAPDDPNDGNHRNHRNGYKRVPAGSINNP